MKKVYLLLTILMLGLAVNGQKLLLHCGNLIDGKSSDVQIQMTIVISGNKITAIEKGFTKAAPGDSVIDLSQKTVMPGLIDMHVHLEGETSKDAAWQRFTLNEADIAFRSTVFAKKL